MNRINSTFVALAFFCNSAIIAGEGLYVGISTGVTHAQADVSKITGSKLKYSSESGKSGTSIGAFLGYNHLINGTPLFIGLEGDINSNNLKMSLIQDYGVFLASTMTATTNYSASGVFKIGVVIKDLMIYAKGGVFKTQWRVSLEGRHHNNETYSELFKTNSYGSVCGFGADYQLNDKWSLGIGHTIHTCTSLEFNPKNTSIKIDPTINTTSLRLTYTF